MILVLIGDVVANICYIKIAAFIFKICVYCWRVFAEGINERVFYIYYKIEWRNDIFVTGVGSYKKDMRKFSARK